jgi:hypothetical protein
MGLAVSVLFLFGPPKCGRSHKRRFVTKSTLPRLSARHHITSDLDDQLLRAKTDITKNKKGAAIRAKFAHSPRRETASEKQTISCQIGRPMVSWSKDPSRGSRTVASVAEAKEEFFAELAVSL